MISSQSASIVGAPLQSSSSLAVAALKRYELSSFGLQLLSAGRYKQLFRVSSPDRGNFLLRMYVSRTGKSWSYAKPGTILRSEAGLRSQMLWLQDLRQAMRLPVQEPVPTEDGSLVGNVSMEGDANTRFFGLVRWIPGERKTDRFSVSEALALGSYMAGLHEHAQRYETPQEFVRPRWDWNSLFGPSSPLWTMGEAALSEDEMKAVTLASEWIWDQLQDLGESSSVFGLIHRDLHPGNLLSHEGTLYAIDFDHCGWGHYLYDLAMPYMALARFGERCEDMREALLEGYQRQRDLPNAYQERLQAFYAMCLITRILPVLGSLKSVSHSESRIEHVWKAETSRKLQTLKELVLSQGR
jgi:Ser/Thr protein kinase RdoA (MazF antagonist)